MAQTRRSGRRAVVTRYVNTLNRYVTEEDQDGIKSYLDKAKTAFGNSEEAHYESHDALKDDNALRESEDYFFIFIFWGSSLWVPWRFKRW